MQDEHALHRQTEFSFLNFHLRHIGKGSLLRELKRKKQSRLPFENRNSFLRPPIASECNPSVSVDRSF
ncbi:Uncharacterized protein TCM_005717 [Theobroma cacao]|uniref:Uncharacterized protein n=1 Tax=Theobroma cacao TaxID=3641 RepID=A0A061E2G6_THECC|nr:Uncharacterized protein TCM_005717 [Theobroma cacao]